MKFSYNRLQTYTPLPTIETLVEIITMHAFEVEDVEKSNGDYILDIKVLPDRAHDALSHRGMAKEIASLCDQRVQDEGQYYAALQKKATLAAPLIDITDTKACPRFTAITITNIEVKPSSQEVKVFLESLGQKSINNIVDATNYVLYDLGKPMHVFDADKIVGTLTVRFAKPNEELTTLDGKVIHLDESILIIADDVGPLSIAGIKGGTRAEVDTNTKNIIIESANFNSTLLRKTSVRLGIKTDAVKRFENGITSEMCLPGLFATTNLILESASTPSTEVSEIADIYPKKEVPYKVGVSTKEVNSLLGTSFTDEEVSSLLTKRGFEHTQKNVLEEVVTLTQNLVDKPYKRGASVLYDAPEAFDCSSLTAFVYKEAGVAIPRIAVDQYVFSNERNGEPALGDLLFVNTGIQKTDGGSYYSQVLGRDIAESAIRYESVEWMPGTPVKEGVDHVGIYIGEGKIIHATSSVGKVVLEDSNESPLFKNGFTTKSICAGDESRFVVTVPFERLDIRIKEDIIDEISKLVGSTTGNTTLTYPSPTKGKVSPRFNIETKLKNIFLRDGFLEIMTTSFSNEGDILIANSVDPKKNSLRNSLIPTMKNSLEKALYNAPVLHLETIKLFEIGKVFKDEKETLSITYGIITKNKKIKKNLKESEEEVFRQITEVLGGYGIQTTTFYDENNATREILLHIDESKAVDNFDEIEKEQKSIVFKPLSVFPFIVRDVAFFSTEEIDLHSYITNIQAIAGENLSDVYIFDRFQKEVDGPISYGLRLIFQSQSKTLTDTEIERPVEEIYTFLTESGHEIR